MEAFLDQTVHIKNDVAWRRKTFYQAWQELEGVPVTKGVPFLKDVRTVERKPWKRTGGKVAFVNLSNQEEVDIQVTEIPGGKGAQSLKPEKHLYEEITLVLEGKGSTTFWKSDKGKKEKVTIDWKKGSLFSPPLNCWHQHSNGSKDELVLLMSATNLPFYLNRFRSLDFIFNNEFEFLDRFDSKLTKRYFSGEGSPGLEDVEYTRQLRWATNFIEDVMSFDKLGRWEEKGSRHVNFSICENTLTSHLHEVPVGGYARAHRHGPSAHVFILDGEGYELLWYEGEKQRRRYEFRAGSMVSPGAWEYHQHFNTGNRPVRQLALRWANPKYYLRSQYEGAADAQIIGPDKEEPSIRTDYEKELKRKGIASRIRITE